MVSPSKLNHSRVANNHQQHSTNKCKLLKGARPLLNHKFYLDIEKHHVFSKIELKIKELGGSVEFFLDKNITHFITDRQLDRDRSCSSPQTPKTPQTPHTPHTPHTPYRNDLIDGVAASPTIIGTNETKVTKPLSRADAILQKARAHSFDSNSVRSSAISQTNCAPSPFHLAKSWGTPIWTPDYALKFLEKVAASIKQSQTSPSYPKGKPANLKHLHGDYIKIETFDKYHRPYYKEINSWPLINLNGLPGDSPFIRHSDLAINKDNNDPNKMTRKNRSKQTRTKKDLKRSSDKQCGYCEICRLEYDTLSIHLQSAEHLSFVKNNDNFVALDSLINNRANVETFLKTNESSNNFIDNEFFGKRSSGRIMARLIRSCDGDVKAAAADYDINNDLQHLRNQFATTRKRVHNRQSEPNLTQMPKERNTPKCYSATVNIQADTAILRSRRESVKRINYDESLGDEENTEGDSSEDSMQRKIQKIRLRGVRWRAPSPNDNTSVSQPIVYKVVNDKPNSSSKISSNRKGPLSEQNKSETGIKVKICRVRESELARLTNEADHFMFPRIFSEYPTDDDRQSTSDHADITAELPSSSDDEKPHTATKTISMPSSMNEPSTTSIEEPKRRRKNQLEKFLNDNTEYYKFQKPESRLRFQEAPVQPNVTKMDDNCGECELSAKDNSVAHSQSINVANNVIKLEDRTGEYRGKQKFELSSQINTFRFAFERIPSKEAWYTTFQRQDECKEKVFEYWGNTIYRKLPFELGPLPPLSSDCCILSKMNITKKDKRQTARKNRGKLPKKFQNTTAEQKPVPMNSFEAENLMGEKSERDGRSSRMEALHRQHPDNCNSSEQPLMDRRKSDVFAYKLNKTDDLSSSDKYLNDSIAAKRQQSEKIAALDIKTDSSSNNSSDSQSERPKSSLSLSKKFALLGEYNQPRKSPREHASTLAILSCLVQQRKKREKERNGGISPEPMDVKPDLDLAYGSDSETTCYQYPNPILLANNSEASIKSEEEPYARTTENCTMTCNGAINNCLTMESQSRLSIKTEKDDCGSIHLDLHDTNESLNIDETVEEIQETAADVNGGEFKIPIAPCLAYDDPKYLCRELDNLLENAYQFDNDFLDIPITMNNSDLISISTPKDFVEIISSVDQGPLRYGFASQLKKKHGLSSFVRGGKRRRNKTGWPTMPRRRSTLQKSNNLEDIDGYNSNTDVDDNDDERLMVGDDSAAIEISQCFGNEADELYIRSRQKLNSHGEECSKDDDYSNDGNSVMFASSSDKAENSDIFTVSSDSLDTVLNEMPPERGELDTKSMKSLINVSDESSSTDVTLAEMLKKQIGVEKQSMKRLRPFKKLPKKSKLKCESKQGIRTAAMRQKIKPIELPKMQPIVCVKKINVKAVNQSDAITTTTAGGIPQSNVVQSSDMRKKNYSSSSNDGGTMNGDGVDRHDINLPPPPPQVTFSPRKLRKPRGRWYRER